MMISSEMMVMMVMTMMFSVPQVGVRHEALRHSSYSSVMLTSYAHVEQPDHTITTREHQGAGAPERYLPHNSHAHLLYAITLARRCPEDDSFCIAFTHKQFHPRDEVLWLERAYLNPATGVGPNIDEYAMSYVMTFQGSL
jgi:hypothetical protein